MIGNLKPLIKDLLTRLEIEAESIEFNQTNPEFLQVNLKVKEEDSGRLIGHHGETIAALQLILGLIIYKQTGAWQHLTVDIDEYRAQRTASLEKLAEDTAHRVKFSGQPIALFNLNPFERRAIHLYLAENKEVITESQGEGRNRHLIVKPSANDSPPN